MDVDRNHDNQDKDLHLETKAAFETCILITYGEVALRGRNKYHILRKLQQDIKNRFAFEAGYIVEGEQGRFLVRRENAPLDKAYALERVRTVFGVHSVSLCIRSENKSLETIEAMALLIMKDKIGPFKVETSRGDKNYPMTSPEISGEIGAALQEAYNQPVSMKENIHTLYVEVRSFAYVFSENIRGMGGLPLASTGTGLSLLSGGIDSPVATFLMAKRGVSMSGVYFHSPPFTSERALLKVEDLAQALAYYTGVFHLYVVDFTETQLLLKESVPLKSLTIMLKRSMFAIAAKIARDIKADGLVTGDNVGQVASQTMQSLAASETATTLPIIRPLATYDKQDIVNMAINIGTYDISIRPYEDCCTLFVADNPETKPRTHIIEFDERQVVDLDITQEKAYKNAAKKTFSYEG